MFVSVVVMKAILLISLTGGLSEPGELVTAAISYSSNWQDCCAKRFYPKLNFLRDPYGSHLYRGGEL